MPTFRPVPEDDVAAFRSMVAYAFRPELGRTDPADVDPDDLPAPWDVGQRYGLYGGDDDLLTVCKHVRFSTRVRGEFHTMDGLSAVASPPESRRRGLVREMLHDSLAESRSNGVYLSGLWPFKRSFYGQYGWATCSRGVAHELDPEALAFTRDHRHGEFVPIDADDWERCDAVHDAHGAPYDLTMDRTEEWWRKRVFAGWDDDPYAYGWERDGDLAAYLTYFVRDGDDGKVLDVHDRAHADHDARLALLRFLADHDSQVETVRLWTPTGDDLLDLVPDDDGVEAELHVGPMFRLVDVPDALEALAYPGGASADLSLDVSDPLAEWNDETYRLDVADGEATVTTEAGDGDADATLGVGALSELYVGYRSASELATAGKLDADAEAVDALDSAFPERRTLLREGF